MPLSMGLDEIETENTNALLSTERIRREFPHGLLNSKAILYLIIWYMSSGTTLFSNKFILTTLKGDVFSLGRNQIATLNELVVCLCSSKGMNQLMLSVLSGYIQMQIMKNISTHIHKSSSNMKNIIQDMIFIGAFRCFTIICGLLALKYVAVSFVATIKSSSPLFTVIISRIMLGEKTSFWTKFSMVPITIGLALCSSFELSFNILGFLYALGTNFFEW